MVWNIRKGVPSDSALKDYDDRMAAREDEIRRPGRKIDVISNEDYERMQQEAAEKRRKELELQMLWQTKFLDASRQRNNMIRYNLFLLFKENFNIDTSNADAVSKQPLAQAIAAVCNSITKDTVAYTHLVSLSKEEGFPWHSDLLREYVEQSLGIPIDGDDILSVRTAAEEKKSLLELIRSQVKRDLEEVTAAMDLLQKLSSIPGYSDPKFAEMLKSNLCRCIRNLDFIMLQRKGKLSGKDLDKKYVAEAQKTFDEAAIYDASVVRTQGVPKCLDIDSEQLKAVKSLLNTKASIRAFYDFCTDTEWSRSAEGLSEEKKVLESLSDAVLRIIDETVAKTYLTHNKIVEESAKVRNYVCGNRQGRFGMEGPVGAVSTAGNTEQYDKACKEESVKFKDMENDTAYRKLFPSSGTSGADLYNRQVSMFTMSGLM